MIHSLSANKNIVIDTHAPTRPASPSQPTATPAAADNSGGAGTTPSLHVDTREPDAPSSPALTNGSDSGVLGDNITNDNTPTFTGTSEANATVWLQDTAELRISSLRRPASARVRGPSGLTQIGVDDEPYSSTARPGQRKVTVHLQRAPSGASWVG